MSGACIISIDGNKSFLTKIHKYAPAQRKDLGALSKKLRPEGWVNMKRRRTRHGDVACVKAGEMRGWCTVGPEGAK